MNPVERSRRERYICPDALVAVDVQNDFIDGSLAVPGGEKVVERINTLVTAMAKRASNLVVTTQDWHPNETAHFAEQPNFVDTWPVHCVGGTRGAELHPDLILAQQPELATRFIKGDVACESPQDDTSYTGALAYNPDTGTTLPDYLRQHDLGYVYVAGLALGDGAEHPLCVDSTARDLKEAGFNVMLVTDAAEAVLPENREKCFQNLAELGIKLVTTEQAVNQIESNL